MTYLELRVYLDALTEEQLGQDVAIAAQYDDNVEVIPVDGFVNPMMEIAYPPSDVDGNVLEVGRPYLTMTV